MVTDIRWRSTRKILGRPVQWAAYLGDMRIGGVAWVRAFPEADPPAPAGFLASLGDTGLGFFLKLGDAQIEVVSAATKTAEAIGAFTASIASFAVGAVKAQAEAKVQQTLAAQQAAMVETARSRAAARRRMKARAALRGSASQIEAFNRAWSSRARAGIELRA